MKLVGVRNFNICIIIMVLCFWCSDARVLAAAVTDKYELGSGENVYQLDQLFNYYKGTSALYRQALLGYEINVYSSDIATENYDSIIVQYGQAAEQRAQLAASKELYQNYLETVEDTDTQDEIKSTIASIDAQIVQYDNSITSLSASKAEAKLQQEIELFYKNNIGLLRMQADRKLSHDFLEKCYSLILLEQRQEYYSAYHKYLNTVNTVEKMKYRRGISNQEELDLSNVNIIKNSMNINQNDNSYHAILTYLKKEAAMKDSYKIELPFNVNRKKYDLDNLKIEFVVYNTNLQQLHYLRECYRNYQSSLIPASTIYNQAALKVQDYQLQYETLRNGIETYVEDTVTSYDNAFINYELATKEMKIAEKNYQIALVKREHKKATQLDVEKSLYEMEASQVSYYQSLYDIIMLQNILDEHIYGESLNLD